MLRSFPHWLFICAGYDVEPEETMNKLITFLKDDAGTETMEWGLVCGLIVVGAIIAITLIGPKLTDMWNNVNNEIPAPGH